MNRCSVTSVVQRLLLDLPRGRWGPGDGPPDTSVIHSQFRANLLIIRLMH